MEQDRAGKAPVDAESSGPYLDHLNLGVDALARSIGDRKTEVGQDVVQMRLDHPCNRFDVTQPRPNRRTVPRTEECALR